MWECFKHIIFFSFIYIYIYLFIYWPIWTLSLFHYIPIKWRPIKLNPQYSVGFGLNFIMLVLLSLMGWPYSLPMCQILARIWIPKHVKSNLTPYLEWNSASLTSSSSKFYFSRYIYIYIVDIYIHIHTYIYICMYVCMYISQIKELQSRIKMFHASDSQALLKFLQNTESLT